MDILSHERLPRLAPMRLFPARHLHCAPRGLVVAAAAPAEVEQETKGEKFTYQAEVDRLLDMIINSLYSNRDVFLRELISNCSDALDKARFLGLTKPEVLADNEKLEIRVQTDAEKHTITIEDTGIGMTRDDLLSQLGTIARSGTRKFMEAVKESKGDANLIGQFGVGFYSSFLVADRVKVQTKHPEDDKQWVWESKVGSHEFSIYEDNEPSLVRGTRITLFLKEDCHELGDAFKLKSLLKQYSEFISFPINLYASKREPKQVADEEATKKKQEEEDTKAKEENREPKKIEDVTKTEYEDVWDWEVQNDNKPIWTRNPKEVTKEQYDSFYKTTFSEFLEPLAHSHFNVEGTIEFSSILFVPGMAPFEQDMMKRSKNIRLFVKRVFISDEFDDDLLPRYLSFIKGVVDSSDLPLNVSREILQENKIVRVIRKQLVRRSLDMIDEISKREDSKDDYKTFWDAFGRNLKLGIIEDTANRDKLASLLRFHSSASEDLMTSLDDYVGRMKKEQKAIYYMAADSVKAAKAAPFVEQLAKQGFEVLYLTEPIDEVAVTNIGKYKEHALEDVSKENLDVSGDDKSEAKEETETKFKGLTDFMKEALGDQVEKVTVSSRLTDSPCIVVTSKFGWSANMERIMKNQTMADSRAMEYMKGRKIMEINPDHELIKALNSEVEAGRKDKAGEMAAVLFETALLTSGFSVESPSDYAAKVYRMMTGAVGNGSSTTGGGIKAEKAEENETVETVTPEVVTDEDPWKK